MITVEYLTEQKKALEEERLKGLLHMHQAMGAIALVESLIAKIQKDEKPDETGSSEQSD